MDSLQKIAPPFIEDRLTSDKLIIIPKKNKQNSNDQKQRESDEIQPVVKETTSTLIKPRIKTQRATAKPMPKEDVKSSKHSIPANQWVDLPPRKSRLQTNKTSR